jgi:response regulator RpfG family c-di-GMP phosphodiesterase
MGIFNFREPKKTDKPTIVVADFDRLESHSVGFVLHGKTHIIRPVKVREFYAAISKLAAFAELQKKEKLTDDEVNQKYLEIIQTLCDTITLKDIQECTAPQIGGLFQLIVDSILGKSQAQGVPMEAAEKKSLVNP